MLWTTVESNVTDSSIYIPRANKALIISAGVLSYCCGMLCCMFDWHLSSQDYSTQCSDCVNCFFCLSSCITTTKSLIPCCENGSSWVTQSLTPSALYCRPSPNAGIGVLIIACWVKPRCALLNLQRGVTGTARMLHALTHSSISRQVREQM